jgi:hypothetical protein
VEILGTVFIAPEYQQIRTVPPPEKQQGEDIEIKMELCLQENRYKPLPKIDLPYLCHSEIINCNIYTNFMQKIPKEVIYIARPCSEMGLRALERDLSPNSEEVVRLYSN